MEQFTPEGKKLQNFVQKKIDFYRPVVTENTKTYRYFDRIKDWGKVTPAMIIASIREFHDLKVKQMENPSDEVGVEILELNL